MGLVAKRASELEYVVLDTPGPTPANTNALPFTEMVGDWFPAYPSLAIDEPVVQVSTRREFGV